MAKSKLIKFGIKNLKYAVYTPGVGGAAGTYGAISDLAYGHSISLESDYNETKLYGDGEVIGVLGDDKGKTGTLTVVNLEKGYEVDMKRKLEIAGGLADIQQRSSVEHALYFEVNGIEDGVAKTYKRWVFGVVSGKPSEAYQQTQDDHTINTYDYPLTIMGTLLQDSAGTANALDANGNTTRVWYVDSTPEDADYATFGATVPAVKMKVA